MADPVYAVSNILHGNEKMPKDAKTNKVIPVSYAPGDVVDTKLFTAEELKALLEAGALSRINPKLAELPPLTLDDLTETETDKPEKPKP